LDIRKLAPIGSDETVDAAVLQSMPNVRAFQQVSTELLGGFPLRTHEAGIFFVRPLTKFTGENRNGVTAPLFKYCQLKKNVRRRR
jgi:hypothetical protein